MQALRDEVRVITGNAAAAYGAMLCRPDVVASYPITPHVATATLSHLEDFAQKLLKAREKKNEGFVYLHVFSPCTVGWGVDDDSTIEVCRMAVRTKYFPLWEAEGGQFRLTHTPATPRPTKEYTRLIRKFRHLSKEELAQLREDVNSNFAFIRHLAEFAQP